MKITVTQSMGAGGHREWSLSIERISSHDQARLEAERAAEREATLRAVAAAPDQAADICRDALS